MALLRITSHAIPPCQPEFQKGPHSFPSNDVVQGEIEGQECNRQQNGPGPGARNIPDKGLDACLYSLLVSLRNMTVGDIEKALLYFGQPELPKSAAMLDLLRSLLYFDPTETASKIQSHSDAQSLFDLLFHLIKNESLLRSEHDGPVAMDNARRLVKEIYARIPLFPQALFLNGADVSIEGLGDDRTKGKYQGKIVKILGSYWPLIEFISQEILVWATLSHENICPLLGVFERESRLFFVYAQGENGTLREWRRSLNPSISDILGRLLEVAKAIQHMHLSGVYLCEAIKEDVIIIDSKICARIPGRGVFLRNGDYQNPKRDVRTFGELFYTIYFDVDIQQRDNLGDERRKIFTNRPSKPEIYVSAWGLIQRCCAEDQKSRPTMDEVVEEMVSWN